LAGYLNYYFPDTCIIHFKGESTKKDSKYVKLFYKAMNQFMRKYFSGNRSRVLITMMDIGIWLQSRVSAATKALPRRNEKVKTNRIKTFLKGDQSSLAALQSNPSLSNRVFVENQHEATEIILCEGPRFSFQQIIETLQQKKSDQSYRIHALASQSIVGSDSKDRPGEAIVW
jgi:N-acetylglucosaminyl-diphospho-decaprenol L-rhamnosyltransferase